MKIPSFIKNSLLFKVTSTNTLLVLIRMGFSLISQKALAILIGAEGLALVGNFKNIISFFEKFSILGTSNGLVKYISEYGENKKELNYLFSVSFIFIAIATLLSFLILFFWSATLNEFVFGTNKDYGYIFKIFSFIVPFMGINAILNSILNGFSEYKLYSKIAFISIITTTFLIVYITYYNGIRGCLLVVSVVPLIHFLIQIVFFSKYFRKHINLREISFDRRYGNKLLSYSFMTVVVVLFINVTDVAIRNLIEKKVGILDAGYWTAMASISKTYMQFTATIFPLYILPKYAKITDTYKFRNEVKKIYKMLLPVIIVGMLMVFFLRSFIIQVLYTNDFLSISKLFKWQLLGDLIKFIAIVISYQFLAKKQMAYFVFTEVLSVILFYAFSVYFIETHGIEGIVIAHFVRYIVYFLVVLYILRYTFIGKNRSI